jgi:hypothetical protein
LFRLLKTRAFLSQESYLNYFQRKFCLKNIGWAGLCRNVLFLLLGDDTTNIDVVWEIRKKHPKLVILLL